MLRTGVWIVTAWMLAACGAFAPPDTSGTLGAQNAGYLAEATAIYQTLQAQRAMIAGTSVAAETFVMEHNSINSQLLATVSAGEPPTRQVIVVNPNVTFNAPIPTLIGGSVPSDSGTPPAVPLPEAQGAQFADTVTTSRIRESDGCAEGSQNTFSANDEQIYVVTRAAQVSSGTQIDVEWLFEGQVVDTASYTLLRDETNFCIWFYLDSFSPGSWSVQLLANGTPIAPALAFTVSAAADGA